ncbi:MAG: AraC family transcriptional regulator [Anaerolineae bacterium]|nr:AraC family transcriptional regulator [Anaerolineae bacterium]
MYAWEAIQTSLDYIETHLGDPLSIEELARVAGLSPFYFQRLFGRLVKKPLFEYLKLRRLAKASSLLTNKSCRITDVAMICGFKDQANFSKVFKSTYGVTAGEYRQHPYILNHFIKPDLKLNFINIDENEMLVSDGMLLEIKRVHLEQERFFTGLTGEILIDELTRGQNTGIASAGLLWDRFHAEKVNIPNLINGGNEFGVLYKGNSRTGYCMYLAGAEAYGYGTMPPYVTWRLVPGDYIVCCFEAEDFEQLVGSAIYKASLFLDRWMVEHQYKPGDFAAEIYYDVEPSGRYMEHWRPLITKQKQEII